MVLAHVVTLSVFALVFKNKQTNLGEKVQDMSKDICDLVRDFLMDPYAKSLTCFNYLFTYVSSNAVHVNFIEVCSS